MLAHVFGKVDLPCCADRVLRHLIKEKEKDISEAMNNKFLDGRLSRFNRNRRRSNVNIGSSGELHKNVRFSPNQMHIELLQNIEAFPSDGDCRSCRWNVHSTQQITGAVGVHHFNQLKGRLKYAMHRKVDYVFYIKFKKAAGTNWAFALTTCNGRLHAVNSKLHAPKIIEDDRRFTFNYDAITTMATNTSSQQL